MTSKAIHQMDFSTRRKRRSAVASVVCILERIAQAEESYLNNMPENLHNSDAYCNTEHYVSLFDDALDVLQSLYDD